MKIKKQKSKTPFSKLNPTTFWHLAILFLHIKVKPLKPSLTTSLSEEKLGWIESKLMNIMTAFESPFLPHILLYNYAKPNSRDQAIKYIHYVTVVSLQDQANHSSSMCFLSRPSWSKIQHYHTPPLIIY